ncbi:MAG: hypothetical protein U0M60_14070 [Clostridia bacterium]|nr:hypothetical protein [Clostridia bacterium]
MEYVVGNDLRVVPFQKANLLFENAETKSWVMPMEQLVISATLC